MIGAYRRRRHRARARSARRTARCCPYQTFRTKTRDIAIGVGSDKLWRTFCPLLGLDALTDDPRYVTNAARNANRPALIAALQEAFLTKTYEEWEAILLPAGIPMGADQHARRGGRASAGRARAARSSRATHPVAGPMQDDGAAGADVGDARDRSDRRRRCSASTRNRCCASGSGLGDEEIARLRREQGRHLAERRRFISSGRAPIQGTELRLNRTLRP